MKSPHDWRLLIVLIRAHRLVELLFRGLRLRFDLGVFAAEAFHASGRIHQFLLAGEKRVAVRADFHVNIALMGGPGSKTVAAGAHDADFVVSGVNGCLHGSPNPCCTVRLDSSGGRRDSANREAAGWTGIQAIAGSNAIEPSDRVKDPVPRLDPAQPA